MSISRSCTTEDATRIHGWAAPVRFLAITGVAVGALAASVSSRAAFQMSFSEQFAILLLCAAMGCAAFARPKPYANLFACASLVLGVLASSLEHITKFTTGLEFELPDLLVSWLNAPIFALPHHFAIAFSFTSLGLVLFLNARASWHPFTAGVLGTSSAIITCLGLAGNLMHWRSAFKGTLQFEMSPLSACSQLVLSLMLISLLDNQLRRKSRLYPYWDATLALLVGTGMSVGIWLAAISSESEALRARFDRSADLRTTVIQNEIDSDIAILRDTERFFSNSMEVSGDEFHGFLDWKFGIDSSILAIDWAPHVLPQARAAWETRAGSKIRSVAIPNRSENQSSAAGHFPVQYSSPIHFEALSIGTDHASDPVRRRAMEAALAANGPRSSEAIKLLRLARPPTWQGDFLVAVPVLAHSSQPASLDSSDLRGFVIGLFRISDLVEKSFHNLPVMTLNASFLTEVEGKPILTYTRCALQAGTKCAEETSLRQQRTLTIAGKDWHIEFTPSPLFMSQQTTYFSYVILLASLLLTFTTFAYLLQIARKRSALRTSDEKFRRLIASVEDYAIFALDTKGRITTWNAGAQRNKGYTAAEVLGKSFEIFYPAEDIAAGKPKRELEIAQRDGRFEEEGLRLRKDGSTMWANVLITPIYGDEGELQGYSKVTRDVTARKETDRLLKQQNVLLNEERDRAERAREAAEQATRAKSQFVANVSHEIRTPLTSIIGFTEELLRRDLDKADREQQLNVVLRNARHLLRMINDILDISKMEAGKLELEIRKASILEILNEIELLMGPRAQQKGLRLVFEFRYPLPNLIHTDSTRLKQIIFNLVDNSLKFTKQGTVRVSTSCDFDKQEIHISVSDTGPGISVEQQDKIFSSFEQGGASITREFGGSGLGLYISRQLAQSLGGNLTLEAESGWSSTFTVTIATGAISSREAIYHGQASSNEKPREQVALKRFQGNVLLAEDVPDTQKLLSMILREHGLEISIANNGQEALDLAAKKRFDLVFMDMQMPVMGGLTATRKLREAGHYGPVVALTANIVQGKVDECVDAGCDGCLAKPFERNALTGVLSLYLTPFESTKPQSERESFQETAREFRRLFSQHVARLQRAYQSQDLEFVRATAHALSGAAAFAYPKMCPLLAALENAAREGNLSICNSLLETLSETHSQAIN